VINSDHAYPLPAALAHDGDRRLVERRVDVVDGDGVVRIRGVAADIAHDAEFAVGGREAGAVHERRDGVRQVDAVDEDVGLDDLGEGAALGCLVQVPLEDVGDAGLGAGVYCAPLLTEESAFAERRCEERKGERSTHRPHLPNALI
jgi:hypothetical protein